MKGAGRAGVAAAVCSGQGLTLARGSQAWRLHPHLGPPDGFRPIPQAPLRPPDDVAQGLTAAQRLCRGWGASEGPDCPPSPGLASVSLHGSATSSPVPALREPASPHRRAGVGGGQQPREPSWIRTGTSGRWEAPRMAWAADPTTGSWLLFLPRHPARSLQKLDWPEAFRTLA